MKRTFRNIIILLSILLISSCIMEDRSKCPSLLELDLSQIDTTLIGNLSIFITKINGNISEEIYVDKDEFSQMIEIYIEKGEYNLYAWGNIDSECRVSIPEEKIEIAQGKSSAPFYFEKKEFRVNMERHTEIIKPDKNYINLEIHIKGMKSPEDFFLSLETQTSGYYFNGEIIMNLHTIPLTYCEFSSVNIIRQYDYNKLKLLINRDNNQIEIPIGAIIMENPPEEFPEKLSDITLWIDFSSSILTIEMEGWKKIFENFCKIF